MGGIVTKRIALAIKVLLTGRKTFSKRDYSGQVAWLADPSFLSPLHQVHGFVPRLGQSFARLVLVAGWITSCADWSVPPTASAASSWPPGRRPALRRVPHVAPRSSVP